MSSFLSHVYHPETDFWRIRQLLIDTYSTTGPGFNWEVRRWDGQHFHRENILMTPAEVHHIAVWENSDGQVIGAAHPEGEPGNFYLQIRPDYRSTIEEEMIAWAIMNLSVADQDGVSRLETFAFEHDAPRIHLLEQHGFNRLPFFGVMRHMRLGNQSLPPSRVAEPYLVRETDANSEDYVRMAKLLNAAFNRDTHTAREYENFVRHSPSFRHDLNLVAQAPDASFAAHVGVTYEPTARYGIFEPVCTHPDHRRKGLAQALMFEGLHRLRALGAQHVHVDTGSMDAANALYNTIGFTETYRGWYWQLRMPS